jgi:hypothetical protein
MWEELEKELHKFWDNDEFILDTKICLPTEENKEEMLEAIKKGWVKNHGEAVLYALSIYNDEPFEEEDAE